MGGKSSAENANIEESDKGTPQGGVISPLFANIYLDKIDKGWKPLDEGKPHVQFDEGALKT